MKVCLDINNVAVVTWVKSRVTSVRDVVAVSYIPADQDLTVDEAFFRQLGEPSHLPALVLVRHLNYSYICWKDSTTVLHWQYRMFVECSDNSFLTGDQGANKERAP